MRRSLFGLAVLLSFALAAPPAAAQGAREVSYSRESVIPLRAKLRFTTMIILPEQEEILDFVCGDKEFWVVSGVQNLAYVKPAKSGAVTNLNLVTSSGRVYSFVLTEGNADARSKRYGVRLTTPVRTRKTPDGNWTAPGRTRRRPSRSGSTSSARRFRRSSSSRIASRQIRSRSTCQRSSRTAASPTSARRRQSCRRYTKSSMTAAARRRTW
jgi:hypothetical protein